jgi:dynein heavy chain
VQEYHDAFIEHCIMELRDDYLTAMRRSALNYSLLRPCELVRLGMQPLQPLLEMPSHWQTSAGRLAARQLPASWRRNVAVAREEITWTLQTLSAHALALSRIWWEGGYSSMLAVDVDSSAFKQQLPMQVRSMGTVTNPGWYHHASMESAGLLYAAYLEYAAMLGPHGIPSQVLYQGLTRHTPSPPVQALAFMRYQRECVERIKSQMWSIWSPKCADMFRRTPPTPINGDAPAYYRSIATLQVRCCRHTHWASDRPGSASSSRGPTCSTAPRRLDASYQA